MRSQAKLILLCVVIAAILYVLISPLPELAATSTLKFPIFGLVLVVVLLIGFQLEIPLSSWYEQIAGGSEYDFRLAFICVRLC